MRESMIESTIEEAVRPSKRGPANPQLTAMLAPRWSDTDPVDYERKFCDLPFDVPFFAWNPGKRYRKTGIFQLARNAWKFKRLVFQAIFSVAVLLVLFAAGMWWLA